MLAWVDSYNTLRLKGGLRTEVIDGTHLIFYYYYFYIFCFICLLLIIMLGVTTQVVLNDEWRFSEIDEAWILISGDNSSYPAPVV